MEGPKQGLSIKVAPSIYQRLKEEIGKGKINGFIERAVAKELDEKAKKQLQEKKQLQQQMIKDYQTVAKDKKKQEEDEL
jgi:rRNA-processing protein FCF1